MNQAGLKFIHYEAAIDRRQIETIKRSFAEKLSSELTEVGNNEYQGWSPEAVEAARELFAERKASGQLAEIDERLAVDRAEGEEFESVDDAVTDPYSSWVSMIAWFYIIGGGLSLLTQGIVSSIFFGNSALLLFQGALDVHPDAIAMIVLYEFVIAAVCTSLILVGRGLLVRKSWARIAALCLCVPLLLTFPIGTVFAIVSFVLLVDIHKYQATTPLPEVET